jgi:hypothetical protein
VRTAGSPWRAALGARHGELDPTLRTYFDTIPEGSVPLLGRIYQYTGDFQYRIESA